MKKTLVISLLCAPLAGGLAQEDLTPRSPPHDPVCGLCATASYREEGHVRDGLAVDMLAGPGEVNQPVTLRFFVNQKPTNWPEDKLELEHEKFMHVIGVGDNLQNFFHIHPVKTGPGMWTVNFTFTNAGNYKIWTDVRWKGITYTFGHPLLKISGAPVKPAETRDFRDQVTTSGYRVTLVSPEPLATGRTNQLQFSIQDASGNAVELENYLGVPMHLVMVKEDLTACLHAHPDLVTAATPALHFSPVFASQGIYKLFAQFRPAKAKLPADESVVAEFYVNVARGPRAPLL